MQNALRRNVPLVALFHWNDSLRRVVFVEVATPVSSRNGVFVRRNVRDPESDDIATSRLPPRPAIGTNQQELTVMGTTADKIAEKIASQLKSKIIDLSGLRAAQQLFQEARIDADGLKKLMSKGHDPCHALYIFAQNFASVLGEQLSEIKETRQFVKIVSDAEDEYQPGGPPLSPLTVSYFTMWALFDVLFGQSHETIGACILRIGPLIEMPPWLLDVIGHMQRSTMGVHVHCGTEGHLVRLRALGSQETKLCHVPSGYVGQAAGELWFVRLLPPAHALFDYHIVFNTPYIFWSMSPSACSPIILPERLAAWDQGLSQQS